MLRAGRLAVPAKITSSISPPRMLLGAVLAHHPAQRLDQVRLAAAVRADDAGQAGLDDELGRLDEGLEAGEAESVKCTKRGLPIRSGIGLLSIKGLMARS